MDRRTFLQNSTLAAGGVVVGVGTMGCSMDVSGEVMTVTGKVAAREIGFVLPHEHVLVDFIGADKICPGGYDQDEVVKVVEPYLIQAKELGCDTLVECTPDYLG
ncbi:MAG TPA: hypothetical protein DIU35_08720 [Candidatus Latescibacteria bacterium]|nr:hypothetical protein [Candidatus Latescibacterota bacterium]|tara:strand:+ start:9089 stop:9400 length:312 start_codon:yes stop_codon:yes gene_type:complete